MTKDSITYQGVEYPLREIFVKFQDDPTDHGRYILVGSKSLVDLLLDDDGDPVSDEAEAVDNAIYFYVADSALECDDAELAGYVDEMVLAVDEDAED